jgi:hypothetical protein
MKYRANAPIYAQAWCIACRRLLEARVNKAWDATILRCPTCQSLCDVLSHGTNPLKGALFGLSYRPKDK